MMDLWAGISGQKSVKELLSKLIFTDKIPQAIIFNGPDGIGKDYLAIRFANILNLVKSHKYTSVDDFPESYKLNSLDEPAVKYIFPLMLGKNESSDDGPLDKLSKDDFDLVKQELEKKSKNLYYKIDLPRANDIKISSIRDITRFLSIKQNSDQFRTIIISSAHLMNEPSQNALLKNLEEPPENVMFILTTPLPDMLRETIRSRSWAINFAPLDGDDIYTILTRYFEVNESTAIKSAKVHDGSLTTALDLSDRNLTKMQQQVINFLRNSLGGRYFNAMQELAPYLKSGEAENYKLFLQMILHWVDDLERFRAGNTELYFSENSDVFERFNNNFPNVIFSQLVSSIEDYIFRIENNNLNLNVITINLLTDISSVMNPKIKQSIK